MQGLPGVTVYIDDTLVAGATEEEHLKRLEGALTWLKRAGLHAQKSKCQFMKSSVTFLDSEWVLWTTPSSRGSGDSYQGSHTMGSERAQVLLGTLSYYSKFLPNLPSFLAPLYRLLCKGARWKWSVEEETFQCSKGVIIYLFIPPGSFFDAGMWCFRGWYWSRACT